MTIPGAVTDWVGAELAAYPVEAHDAAWLVMIVLVTALATMTGLLASDVAHGLLDPRVRERLLRREGSP